VSVGVNYCLDIVNHQQQLAELAGLDAIPEGLWPSWGDGRVDAIVGMAPAAGYYGPEGLKAVSVPAMFMVGSGDTFILPEVDTFQVYRNLASERKTLITFANADHTVFLLDCQNAPWLIDYGAFWACSDPVWDMERAHDLINHFTTAFLLATLKGDTDAADALTPDAVTFSGITYEAEGF
jgi:predicted dienelactone hydrolase